MIQSPLAIVVDNFIKDHGIRKTFIAEKLGISYPYFQKLMSKKNFTIDDANRILAVIGYKIDYDIKPLKDWQYYVYKVQIKKV